MKVENEFGGCPQCGQADGFLSEWRCNVFFCVQHKTRWIIGSDSSDSFHSAIKEEQRMAWQNLGVKNFTLVDPIFDDTGLFNNIDDRLIYAGEQALREACEDQGLTLDDVDLSVIINWVLARVEEHTVTLEEMDRELADARAVEDSYHQATKSYRSRLVLRE